MSIQGRIFHAAILTVCPNFSGSYNPPDGPTIEQWDSPCPQPTQAEIDAAMPAAKAALIMSAIRAERDRRLAATDYLAMPDYPAPPAGIAAYRQALRDFPATVNVAALSGPVDVNALNWPKL